MKSGMNIEAKTKLSWLEEGGQQIAYYPDIKSGLKAKELLLEKGIKNVEIEAEIRGKVIQVEEQEGNQDSNEVYALF